MAAVTVDVDVATIAGGRAFGKPGGHVGTLRTVLGLGFAFPVAVGQRRRIVFARHLDTRFEHAGVQVPADVGRGERERAAQARVGGLERRPSGNGLAGELLRELHDLLEARQRVDAGEIRIILDGVGVAESEVNGLFQFVEREASLFAVGKGTGMVVAPRGVFGHQFDTRLGGRFHRLGVAAPNGTDEFVAQLGVP